MIQRFLDYERKVKNLSENTIDAYGTDLRAFAAWLKNTGTASRWSEVHKRKVDAYMAYCHDNGEKPATIRRRLASIRALYNYFRKEGMIATNPAQYCEAPKKPRTLPNTVNCAAIEGYICDATKPLVMRLMIAIFYETGIRISELTALEVRDIDQQKRTMRVYGKGLKARVVYYGDYTARLLPTYIDRRRGQVFQGSDQCHRQIRWEIHRALCKYATNGKASPHTIRHTYATRMLEMGMPIQSLQTILGHENVETTRNYARVTNEQVMADYKRAWALIAERRAAQTEGAR